jgi:hypothetical protein
MLIRKYAVLYIILTLSGEDDAQSRKGERKNSCNSGTSKSRRRRSGAGAERDQS